jgi:DNA-binding Xre family transcriptional regulator
MEMRLRLPELLEEHKTTAYAIAQQSDGRIDQSTLYRLTRKRGVVRYLDTTLLEALCDVLGVEPGALLEREKRKRGK